MKEIHALCFLSNVEDFQVMNLFLISKFPLVFFFRNISFEFIMICMSPGPLLYMFIGDGCRWGRDDVVWCDFEAFLHHLQYYQITFNDAECLVCVYLMFSISYRISSAGG